MVQIRQLMVGALLTAAAAMVPESTAFASGPGGGSGNNGRTQQTLMCGGQMYTVAVTNGGNSAGAGQIVDANGHGIPTSGTFTVTDTTAHVVLFSGPAGISHGHPKSGYDGMHRDNRFGDGRRSRTAAARRVSGWRVADGPGCRNYRHLRDTEGLIGKNGVPRLSLDRGDLGPTPSQAWGRLV